MAYPFDEILLSGASYLPVWQGDTLWILDAETLKPVHELKIPGFTSDGMLMMMSMVRGAYVPPHIDLTARKAFFILSKCADEAANERMQPGCMKDYLVIMSW
jgi:hypothetical protein